MADATSWQASARGTEANYQARLLAVRDAILTGQGQTANATTLAQWSAAMTAAQTLLDAVQTDVGDEFLVQVSGFHDGLIDANAQPAINVSVQRIS